MSKNWTEDSVKLLNKLSKHQNIAATIFLVAGISLGVGLYLGQILAEGKLVKITSGYETYQIKVATASSEIATPAKSTSSSKFINLNSASFAELDSLPGIGQVYAQKIIGGRPYQSVSELLSRKLIPAKTYNSIKGLVSVE